jgi:putative ABC transport system permease protein
MLGVAIGVAGGAALGALLIRVYNDFFRFPVLTFRVPPSLVLQVAGLAVFAAAAGAFGAVRRAVRIPPAEAMRPEAPARYRRSVIETPFIARRLGTAGRMVVRNLTRHPFRAAASIFGMAFAVAILMIGFVFIDIVEQLIRTQFWDAERQDVTVTFVEPRGPEARHALAHEPGVLAVETQRSVAARISSGHRARYVSVTGFSSTPRFKRMLHRSGAPVRLPPRGLVLSLTLARVLGVEPGDTVTVDVLEGPRPRADIIVAGTVDDILGLSAYMHEDAVHALMREGNVSTSALILLDSTERDAFAARLKRMPIVAGAGFKRTVLAGFRDMMAANMATTVSINLLFAGIIAFGVVYNAARISLSERSRELASLRVLGFTRGEISLILLGELALLTLLSLPVGLVFGYSLSMALVRSIESEVYRFPLSVSPQALAWSCLGIIAAALASGLLVRRRLDHLDLVAVLKVRE